MRDILREVYEGLISPDDAWNVRDEVVGLSHSGELDVTIPDALGLDNYEWTAWGGFGIDPGILARWRYYGWPKTCSYCGREVDYKKYGWMIKNDQLKCLRPDCPSGVKDYCPN